MILRKNIFLPPPVRPLDEEPMATGGRQVCTAARGIVRYACLTTLPLPARCRMRNRRPRVDGNSEDVLWRN